MILGEDKWLLFTGRHFWNRKCRKKTWWQQEFAVFKCEATANSVTGHVCVNSNKIGCPRVAVRHLQFQACQFVRMY